MILTFMKLGPGLIFVHTELRAYLLEPDPIFYHFMISFFQSLFLFWYLNSYFSPGGGGYSVQKILLGRAANMGSKIASWYMNDPL